MELCIFYFRRWPVYLKLVYFCAGAVSISTLAFLMLIRNLIYVPYIFFNQCHFMLILLWVIAWLSENRVSFGPLYLMNVLATEHWTHSMYSRWIRFSCRGCQYGFLPLLMTLSFKSFYVHFCFLSDKTSLNRLHDYRSVCLSVLFLYRWKASTATVWDLKPLKPTLLNSNDPRNYLETLRRRAD